MEKRSSNGKPLQRIPLSKKLKRDSKGESEWGRENAEYFIQQTDFLETSGKRKDILDYYKYYNNDINEDVFHYITNPLNSSKSQHTNFPARIRSYNILRPNMDLYMGEFIKRAFPFTVINLNTDAYNTYEENRKKALYQNVVQRWINELNGLGVDTGHASQEVQLPEEIEEQFRIKYSDIKAAKGQKKLKRLEREKDIFVTFKELFKDYLIAGEVISKKEIERGDIFYNRVSPLHFSYGLAPNKTYIEDADWQVHRIYMTPSDVTDKFYDEIKEEHREYLDNLTGVSAGTREGFLSSLIDENTEDSNTELVAVYHVCWKSQKKLGIYYYNDEFGRPQQQKVDETFKLSDLDKELGHTVKWMWVNEGWELYSIDGKYILRVQPIKGQRNTLNNFSKCKLPYNGIRFSNTHSHNISPLSLGIPYQVMFIIVNYYIERTLAKNKGKVALMDINVIPDGEEWDEEKFLYYAESLGWALIDRDKLGVDKSFNQYNVLDFSLYEHLSQLIAIKDSIKDDYDELLGITRQRKGQVQASDSVGGTQAATFQSSLISELLFTNFDDFRRSDYQGLLDLLKLTTLEGEKGFYINDDLQQEIYNIEPGELANVDLGLYVSNNPVDLQNLAQFKQYANAFAQNGADPSTVLSIVRSDNIHGLDAKLKKIEALQQERNAAEAKTEQEKIQLEKSLEREMEQFRHELAVDLQNKDHDRLDNRELLKGDIDLALKGEEKANDSSNEDTIDQVEKRSIERQKAYTADKKISNDASIKSQELKLKEQKIISDEKIAKETNETNLQIAKENKNKYDKTS